MTAWGLRLMDLTLEHLVGGIALVAFLVGYTEYRLFRRRRDLQHQLQVVDDRLTRMEHARLHQRLSELLPLETTNDDPRE